jgi:hypothetical protein
MVDWYWEQEKAAESLAICGLLYHHPGYITAERMYMINDVLPRFSDARIQKIKDVSWAMDHFQQYISVLHSDFDIPVEVLSNLAKLND